ncbi:hypothetical protein NOJ28_19130 [Neorhizobium galegae]|uniref:hypothetical protein n=1 Tax=Neorhizobium galegae TaxID=399 RepID=UPI00062130B0|nr:hypothetical protein [Neorhizobium galegae]MCQ1767661.1 hypothetical protein [Neorhizobium galegae]MCQ1848000.1 hypothetical protein [Neorhizobium galegae]CDZ42829.1 Hypothetical protein NGAL_HAMBI1146_56000 [Neorhizobium galegae bv. officinalis]
MIRLISNAGLAVALSLGAMGAFSVPASAQDIQLRVGPDGVRPMIRDRDRDYDRRGCSPGEARAAARDEGFRNARVVRVTSRSVTVEGFTRNGPDRITFANRRGCPEI